jgi:hypothetical protein
MATEPLPSRWKRDDDGNVYRVLTDRERTSLESSEMGSSPPGQPERASRMAAVAMYWLIWLAAFLLVVAGLLLLLA